MEIVSATSNFDFQTTSLADPQPLTGQAGFYFTALTVGDENKSLCLQLPECVTKQGIVNLKNAKYMDLMFERDKHDDLMRWVEKLEYTCQDIIDTKKDLWFQTELTRDDIETMMTQLTRLYQSGKYVLMRVFIETSKSGSKCIAYDENEIGFDLDILEANKSIIPLVMIEGVKFSSRSFEISLKLVQVMVLGNTEKKSACLIKRSAIMGVNSSMESDNTLASIAEASVEEASVADASVAEASVADAKLYIPTIAQESISKPAASISKSVSKPLANVVQPNLVKPIESLAKATIGGKELKPILKSVSMPATAKALPILEPVKKELEEVTINFSDLSDSISLKNPNEVYYEIYRKARENAKLCRMKAIEAFLEAKQIKTKYMLNDLDDSDEDSLEDEDEDYKSDLLKNLS